MSEKINPYSKNLMNQNNLQNYRFTNLIQDAFNESEVVEKCERVKIIGDAMENSSAYLFPFIVEYSIIGSHVLYSMWRNIGKNPEYLMLGDDSTEDEHTG